MQTVPDDDDHNVDAVSGATVWSDAIRHATIAALRSAPVSGSESTVLAPTLTAQTCVPNASYKYIDVAMSADEDTLIRYTLDGTDPTAASTEAASIGWSGDIGVRLSADPTNHPSGQVIEVRAGRLCQGRHSLGCGSAVLCIRQSAEQRGVYCTVQRHFRNR